jgi:pimeloyl-ACP methyl ester carboxylesterase
MSVDAVLFVPGICGSVLKQDDITIWPGTPANAVFQTYPDEYVDILATSTTIRATDVLRSVPLTVFGVPIYHVDGYGKALRSLEGMRFSEAGGTLIPFAYDWRADIRTSAAALHARLSQPDLGGKRVAIVSHSMGGLVARYALEKLGIPGGVRIELLALVASPHLGAPVALQNVLGLRPEIFLSAAQCRAVLRNPKFPSAYQLLPPPRIPVLLAANAQSGFLIQDPFDPVFAQQLGLVQGSLDAASEFAADLPFIGPGFQPPCRYVAIAGNAQKTIVANYHNANGASAVEEETSGDGTVPLWSAAPPGIPVRYVAATHGDIFKDGDTEAMLRAVLRPGSPGARLFSLPTGQQPAISVQAINTSVLPGVNFTVAIVADRPTATLDATVKVERAFAGGRMETEEVPVRYVGGPIRTIPLDFTAPQDRAVLKFSVRPKGAAATGDPATVLVVT